MPRGWPGSGSSACVFVLFLCASGSAAPAVAQSRAPTRAPRAQPPAEAPAPEPTKPEEPAGYLEAVAEAVREFAAHHYEEARALFARAHALYPNARTERGMGLSEFELRNYGASVRHFEAALKSDEKPLTAELRTDTERMLERANQFVARVHVDLKPSAANLVIDGVSLEVPTEQALLLQVGEHTLEVQAPGFITEKRKLSVQGGEERALTIVLAQTAPSAPPVAEKTEKHWYKNPWLWTGVGVVVAGAAAGTAVALTRPDNSSSPETYQGSAGILLRGP